MYNYVVYIFLSQVIFVYLLFLGMVMYAHEKEIYQLQTMYIFQDKRERKVGKHCSVVKWKSKLDILVLCIIYFTLKTIPVNMQKMKQLRNKILWLAKYCWRQYMIWAFLGSAMNKMNAM